MLPIAHIYPAVDAIMVMAAVSRRYAYMTSATVAFCTQRLAPWLKNLYACGQLYHVQLSEIARYH